MKKHNLIVADQAFAPLNIFKKYNLINIFPQFKNDGAYRNNLNELQKRSIIFSLFYQNVTPKLNKYFCDNILDIPQQVKYVTKPILINITTIFVDRYIRIINLLQNHKIDKIYVLSVKSINNVKTLKHFDSINSNWHANQDIIQRILKSLGFESLEYDLNDQDFEYPNSHIVPNITMKSYDNFIKKIFVKINFKLNNFISFFLKHKILNLGMSIDDYFLKKAGLFNIFGIFIFSKNINSIKISSTDPDYILRNQIKNELYLILKEDLIKLLNNSIECSYNTSDKLIYAWIELFVDWFPTTLLENISLNVNKFDKLINKINSKSLLGDTLTSENGILISIAAKKRNMTIIGCQHNAGHYGYIEDLSLMYQFELNHYDYMITFGWNKVENYFPNCKFIKLPSPKLSETPLKKSLDKYKPLNSNKQCDVLFLSNLFHRFPHASTCGQARVDFIDQIFESHFKLINILINNKIYVNHKPYSMRFVDLYKDHYMRLQNQSNVYYNLITSQSKGLSINLIKDTKLILWDQLGSGAVECFSSEIPTMILWERIYSRENKYSKKSIERLEKFGIIHKNTDSLITEINIYLKNPSLWFNNFERKNAIKLFCNEFSWSTKDWSIFWKNNLNCFI